MKQENFQDLLSQISTEFDRLKEATDYIDHSKESVKILILKSEELSNRIISKVTQTIELVEKNSDRHFSRQSGEMDKLKEGLIKLQHELKLSSDEIFNRLDVPTKVFEDLSVKSEHLVKKIDTINFPERLDKLENSVNTTFTDILQFNREVNKQAQELIQEISKINFESLFSGLKNSISNTVSNISSLNKDLENEIRKQSEIQNAFTENLVRNIEDIDIPNRFKSLNDTISRSVNEIKSANTLTQIRTEELTKAIEAINISQRLDKLDATIAGITQSIQSVLHRLESMERNLKEGQQNKANDIISISKQIEISNKEQLQLSIKYVIDQITALAARNLQTTEAQMQKINKENKMIKAFCIFTLLLIIGGYVYFIFMQ